MVGNPVTNWKYDTEPAYIEMAYWHGLVSDTSYADIKYCRKQFEGLEFKRPGDFT